MAQKKLCSIPECGKPARNRGWCVMHYARWRKYNDPLKTFIGEKLQWLQDHMTHSEDECLIWPFHRNIDGYPSGVRYCGKRTPAARLMCILSHGEPQTPADESAHSCGNGNKGCIAPKHLSWKTPKENQADRIIHGTHNRGRKNGQCKLTEDQILEIRSSPESRTELSQKYGISKPHIYEIKNRKKWAWL